MAFDTSAQGPYTGVYGTPPVAMGLFEGPIRTTHQPHAIDRRADQFGQTVISGVYTGGDVFCSLTLKEWQAGVKSIINVFDSTPGQSGIIGRFMEDMAEVLKLTAVPNTPAATQGPLTRTFNLAIVSPESNVETLLGNVERNIPIIFRCYPEEVSPNTAEVFWFTDT